MKDKQHNGQKKTPKELPKCKQFLRPIDTRRVNLVKKTLKYRVNLNIIDRKSQKDIHCNGKKGQEYKLPCAKQYTED